MRELKPGSADSKTTLASDVTLTVQPWSLHDLLHTNRPPILSLIACFVGYLFAAAFGRWMMVVPDISITVWPPNGVILGALLIHRRRCWPWWIAVAAAGELTANTLWFHNPILPALGYVTANICEVLAGALILWPSFSGRIQPFTTLRQVVAFLGLGVLLAPVVGATLISSIDAFIGKNAFEVIWPLLWLGDATGILIATPLAVLAATIRREGEKPSPSKLFEGGLIGLVLVGLVAWHLVSGLPNAFLLFIPILWAALRFQLAGTSLTVLLLAVTIGYFTQDTGLMAEDVGNSTFRHAILQALIMVGASMGLIVAATMREQKDVAAKMSEANAQLEQRVLNRTREIEEAENRFRATFENAAVGIAMVDTDGHLVRVNESMAQMLGYGAAEMEGQPLDRFTHSDDLQKGREAMDRLRSGAADTYDVEKRYIAKNGETVWGHTSVSCVRDRDGKIAYGIKVLQNITDRKRSEEVRQLLMREVNHRSKNMLATVQAIARQTAAKTPQSFMENFGRRLQALAANQDLLVKSGWESVDLNELVRSQLRHFEALVDKRIRISGPDVPLSPSAAQAIGMAVHELSTNAAKHGALSNDAGCVAIDWTITTDEFRMEWRESGGPLVEPPSANGFGTTVLDNMARSALSGEVEIDYPATGLVWRLSCAASSLRRKGAPNLEHGI